ncbi:hypothetical protein [Pseudoprimorskyibacter insulae]|nr:hypothetical protein [Pseudoprimorskyibacter insulae]
MSLIETFGDELSVLKIATSDFLSAAQSRPFNLGAPVTMKGNFVEACNVICELVVPRWASWARISFSACHREDAEVEFACQATSTLAGRSYIEALSADAAKVLLLHDLLVGKAGRLGLKVRDVQGGVS